MEYDLPCFPYRFIDVFEPNHDTMIKLCLTNQVTLLDPFSICGWFKMCVTLQNRNHVMWERLAASVQPQASGHCTTHIYSDKRYFTNTTG